MKKIANIQLVINIVNILILLFIFPNFAILGTSIGAILLYALEIIFIKFLKHNTFPLIALNLSFVNFFPPAYLLYRFKCTKWPEPFLSFLCNPGTYILFLPILVSNILFIVYLIIYLKKRK